MRCPFSLDAQFATYEKQFGVKVTPELWSFVSRVFEIDEEMEMGLRPECERLEMEAVKVLRRERRAYERFCIDKSRNQRGE